MRNRSFILTTILVLTLGLILSACGGNPPAAPAPDNGTGTTGEATTEATAEANATTEATAEANATTEATAEANATTEATAEANATTEATAEANATTEATAEANATTEATAGAVSEGDVEAGQHVYAEVCTPCHGQDATGIEGIGLDLTASKFIGALTTAQLADMVTMGRGITSDFNVTEIKMPAKGGRPDLTAQDVMDAAAYLHSLSTEIGATSKDATDYLAWIADGGVEEPDTAEAVTSEGLSGAALDGQTTYLRFCSVCHGNRGQGIESLGKPLIGSEFVAGLDDAGLIEFIKTGRTVDDELNDTGIEMLAYGGQESLTDKQLTNLEAYLRFVNESAPLEVQPSDTGGSDVVAAPSEEEAFAVIGTIKPPCFACHLIGEKGNKNGPGPHLNGVGARAASRIDGMTAKEYIRQSILDPGAFIVDECPKGPCINAMPKNFKDQLDEAQLNTLVEFLASLTTE